ncbi:MAG: FadR/GntR family transcriptional regulator [Hyphomicrobiales bacterium]|nr:FadR/GntR family transcriptional regulator [Hyphomicrobiales bacterium]
MRTVPPIVGAVPRRSLHDEVVATLGRGIVSGTFGEGTSLPNEADLAGDLGVSRNVLREAVKVLVAKGMLDVRPKTGTTVRMKEHWHMLDPEVLAWEAAGDLHLPYAFNFTEFRLILEPKASFLAARRATDAEIHTIRARCDALEACVGHLDRMPNADIAFHQSIHRASHNALLQHLGVLTAAIMRVQVTYTASRPGDFERGLPLHRELTEAITVRNAPLAERVSRALCEMPYLDLAGRVDLGDIGLLVDETAPEHA